MRNKRKIYDILLLCIVMVSFVHEGNASSKTIVPFTRATKKKVQLPKKKKLTRKERQQQKWAEQRQWLQEFSKQQQLLSSQQQFMTEQFRPEQETRSSYEGRTHEGKKIIGNAKFMIFYILMMAALYTAANDVIEQFTDALFQEKTFEKLYDAPEFEKYKRETLAIVEDVLANSDVLQKYGTSLTAEEITRRYYQSLFQQGITDNEGIVLYLSPSLYQSYSSLRDMGFALGVGAGTLYNLVSFAGFVNLCVGIPVLGIMLYGLFKYKYNIRQGVSTTNWQEVLLRTYNNFEQDFAIYDEFTDQDKEFIVNFIADHNELDADAVLEILLGAIRGFEAVYSVYSRDSVQKYLTDFSVITNELNFDPTVTPPLLENMRNIVRFKDGMLAKEFQGLSKEQRYALQYSLSLPEQEMRRLQQIALDTFLSQILRLSVKQQVD